MVNIVPMAPRGQSHHPVAPGSARDGLLTRQMGMVSAGAPTCRRAGSLFACDRTPDAWGRAMRGPEGDGCTRCQSQSKRSIAGRAGEEASPITWPRGGSMHARLRYWQEPTPPERGSALLIRRSPETAYAPRPLPRC
jgi:hypothetical protein